MEIQYLSPVARGCPRPVGDLYSGPLPGLRQGVGVEIPMPVAHEGPCAQGYVVEADRAVDGQGGLCP